jgi:hypothetical protein
MIAVVDHKSHRGIEIRAASPAGLSRLLMYDDVVTALGQAHRSRQTGDAGADNVNCA